MSILRCSYQCSPPVILSLTCGAYEVIIIIVQEEISTRIILKALTFVVAAVETYYICVGNTYCTKNT